MFNQLFQRPHALKHQLNAPLLEDRLRYLTYRAEQGTRKSGLYHLAHYQLILIKYLPMGEDRLITLKEIISAANRYALYAVKHYRLYKNISHSGCKKRFIQYATHWLRFLGRLEIPVKPPIPMQISEFADYMRNEKGLSEITISNYCCTLNKFFSQTKKTFSQSLTHLRPRLLDELLIQEFDKGIYARSTIQLLAKILRIFLRYAEQRGWCSIGMADSIKSPRLYKHQGLPSSPSWEDVQRLLKTTEGNNRSNIRDRAIILLLSVYGLRASEVRQLRLEDFDWEQEIFQIKHSKRGPRQKFPLVQTVGQALVCYLKEVRLRCSPHPEVFLSLYAPFKPLVSLVNTVSRRWKPLNVAIKYHGPHSLRHACATRLINQGVSLKTIADQLGHRDLDSTRIYAKLDLSKLREVANFNMGGLL